MAKANRIIAASVMIVLVWGGGIRAIGGLSALAQEAGWECASPVIATPAQDTSAAAASANLVEFPESGGELTVFAAASLTEAFGQIKSDLEAANPDLNIVYNFAGSQTLVTQLTEGAEADVFASANTAQMTVAQRAGLVAVEPVIVVRYRLVVVVPADNPAAIMTPADLSQEGLRLVLAQPEVPVGSYARQAVCLMAQDVATYGDGFVAGVAATVVSEEEDVRDVLAKVQLGEADAGIVYVSDAFIAGDEVHLIDIPDDVNVLATYPIAPVVDGDAALAAAFISYVLGAGGQEALAAYGFAPIR